MRRYLCRLEIGLVSVWLWFWVGSLFSVGSGGVFVGWDRDWFGLSFGVDRFRFCCRSVSVRFVLLRRFRFVLFRFVLLRRFISFCFVSFRFFSMILTTINRYQVYDYDIVLKGTPHTSDRSDRSSTDRSSTDRSSTTTTAVVPHVPSRHVGQDLHEVQIISQETCPGPWGNLRIPPDNMS